MTNNIKASLNRRVEPWTFSAVVAAMAGGLVLIAMVLLNTLFLRDAGIESFRTAVIALDVLLGLSVALIVSDVVFRSRVWRDASLAARHSGAYRAAPITGPHVTAP